MTPRVPLALLALLWCASAARADVGEVAILADHSNILQAVGAPNIYLGRAACAFYQTHPDDYDAIFVFTTASLNFLTRTQQGWPVKRAALGIGRDVALDSSTSFCTQRLRHAVKMGDVGSFSDDPGARYQGIPAYPFSGVQLMAHEFGHQWMASVTYDRGDGVRHCLVRGFEPTSELMPGDCDNYRPADFNQHWSYYFDTGSVMYGSRIQDLGGGRFALSNDDPKYSPLDQYLMGLRDPAEVPPMFLIDVGDLQGSGSAALPLSPSRTAMESGTRVDITIEDIVRASGPRMPPREACHWKGAFIIVHEPGTAPSAQEIARVDAYRRRWEEFYATATDRRGSFDTTLGRTGLGTLECPSPVAPPPPDAGVSSADALSNDVGVARDASSDAGFISLADATLEDAALADAAPEDAEELSSSDGAPAAADADQIRTLASGGGCGCGATRSSEDMMWAVLLLAIVARRSSR